MPIDEDFYKPIITNSNFNSNYTQYESIGGEGKDKNLSVKEYLDKMKRYLSVMINNHKGQGKKWRIDSGNKTLEPITQGEFKI